MDRVFAVMIRRPWDLGGGLFGGRLPLPASGGQYVRSQISSLHAGRMVVPGSLVFAGEMSVGASANTLMARKSGHERYQKKASAVKIPEFADFSMGRPRLPALHFAGIRSVWADFLANSNRGIPSNRKL